MIQEDKELFFVDLCARLPYNVALNCTDDDERINFECYLTTDILREIQYNHNNWIYKPYLFPLSSMTEEQEDELIKFMAKDWNGMRYHTHDSIDWLNKNHFDYRGLIVRGLAIDATNLNIY